MNNMIDKIEMLFEAIEKLYGSSNTHMYYTMQCIDGEFWFVRNTYIPYERNETEQLIKVKDLCEMI